MGRINDAQILGHLGSDGDIYSNLDADSRICGKKGFAMTDAHTPGLLPCPFCGGEAANNTVTYSEKNVARLGLSQWAYYGINCIKFGVSNVGIMGFETLDEAAAAWNARASALPDLLAVAESVVAWGDLIERALGINMPSTEAAFIDAARAAIAKAKGDEAIRIAALLPDDLLPKGETP